MADARLEVMVQQARDLAVAHTFAERSDRELLDDSWSRTAMA
jgi:hypothetical protein